MPLTILVTLAPPAKISSKRGPPAKAAWFPKALGLGLISSFPSWRAIRMAGEGGALLTSPPPRPSRGAPGGGGSLARLALDMPARRRHRSLVGLPFHVFLPAAHDVRVLPQVRLQGREGLGSVTLTYGGPERPGKPPGG